MCFYDLEHLEVFKNEIRKARKSHRCCDCCRVIPKGSRYEYIAGIMDHEFEEYKTCAECVNLRNEIAKIEISHGCSINEAYPGIGGAREAAYEYPGLKQLIVV